jgi:hypothetical protein
MMQGNALKELLAFFASASALNAIQSNTMLELFDYISIDTQASAKSIAHVTANSSNKETIITDYLTKLNAQGATGDN